MRSILRPGSLTRCSIWSKKKASAYLSLEEEVDCPAVSQGVAATGPIEISVVDEIEDFDIGEQETPRQVDNDDWSAK